LSLPFANPVVHCVCSICISKRRPGSLPPEAAEFDLVVNLVVDGDDQRSAIASRLLNYFVLFF